jgi:spore coat polysaccharide biosynthesis predicted glycosyltransferase SpsG/CMP-N-acetylneuraminic acid synthetase
MHEGKKVLIVVPARAGSKGIPGKNVKMLAGRPLIAHVLSTLQAVPEVDTIVVSTDDPLIASVSEPFAETLIRPEPLSRDTVTLDPVVTHAYGHYPDHDVVITIQPTSPLLSARSISSCIRTLIEEGSDSVLTVKDDRHLAWSEQGGRYVPLYEERVNRQELPARFVETGGVIGCTREQLESGTRIGKRISLIELPLEEAIDIDTYLDWSLVESLIRAPSVALVVRGSKQTGLGHVYRMLLIASRLSYRPMFFIPREDALAQEKVSTSFYELTTYGSAEELDRLLETHERDLIVLDILDTERSFVERLKRPNRVIVTFEDFGPGSRLADARFNALYESSHEDEHSYFGYRYVCLRDEFLRTSPRETSESVEHVLITFGGTDPNDLTSFTLAALERELEGVQTTIITGIGYDRFDELERLVGNRPKVSLVRDVIEMAPHMRSADLMITSNGRTTYEAASLGVPTIVICQNARECKHTFGEVTHTVVNLGLHSDVGPEMLRERFRELAGSYEMRKELHERMLSLDLTRGTQRVIDIIESLYRDLKGY